MIPFRNYRTAADEFSITDLRASFPDQMNAQVQLSHHDAYRLKVFIFCYQK